MGRPTSSDVGVLLFPPLRPIHLLCPLRQGISQSLQGLAVTQDCSGAVLPESRKIVFEGLVISNVYDTVASAATYATISSIRQREETKTMALAHLLQVYWWWLMPICALSLIVSVCIFSGIIAIWRRLVQRHLEC
jgi:hypothetical protein